MLNENLINKFISIISTELTTIDQSIVLYKYRETEKSRIIVLLWEKCNKTGEKQFVLPKEKGFDYLYNVITRYYNNLIIG